MYLGRGDMNETNVVKGRIDLLIKKKRNGSSGMLWQTILWRRNFQCSIYGQLNAIMKKIERVGFWLSPSSCQTGHNSKEQVGREQRVRQSSPMLLEYRLVCERALSCSNNTRPVHLLRRRHCWIHRHSFLVISQYW